MDVHLKFSCGDEDKDDYDEDDAMKISKRICEGLSEQRGRENMRKAE